jgi:hypothetical protein
MESIEGALAAIEGLALIYYNKSKDNLIEYERLWLETAMFIMSSPYLNKRLGTDVIPLPQHLSPVRIRFDVYWWLGALKMLTDLLKRAENAVEYPGGVKVMSDVFIVYYPVSFTLSHVSRHKPQQRNCFRSAYSIVYVSYSIEYLNFVPTIGPQVLFKGADNRRCRWSYGRSHILSSYEHFTLFNSRRYMWHDSQHCRLNQHIPRYHYANLNYSNLAIKFILVAVSVID